MQNFIKINENDSVVVALNTLPHGETLNVKVQGTMNTVTALEEIPAGCYRMGFPLPACHGANVLFFHAYG